MNKQLVECIPNFSAARQPEVVEAIQKAITAVPGVYILDRHSDLDHNRTVLTFVGPPAAVEEAAFQGIAQAVKLIDLDVHRGEHPRIGAADVVPFVPISGVSMADCVSMAQRVGERIGAELSIPVYLYEEAATRPERKNLENIRRGQYEALKEELGRKPERDPDYGPPVVGPAGATVIGARQPLIAFNVYLATDDVEVAKKIARMVRYSSGGLRYVKALGLMVEGRAQVSMNLTNFRKTPIAAVVELIRREAARFGTAIHHSELVGLIPQEALVDAAVWYAQLDQFDPEQILELRLAAAKQNTPEPLQETSFLEALASANPTPGGGSAAAYTGAIGAALTAMVAKGTLGKRKYADVEAQMNRIALEADELKDSLQQEVAEDAAAFDQVMAAYRLPKDSQEEKDLRSNAIQSAVEGAARVPLRVMGQLFRVLELASETTAKGNINALTDAASGAEFAYAALRSASLNVRVNLTGLKDPMLKNTLWEELENIEGQARTLIEQIRNMVRDRGGPALA